MPVLAVLGVAGAFACDRAEKAHLKAEWAHCGNLPPSWQMYVFAHASLACGLAAFVLLVRLAARGGQGAPSPSGARFIGLAIALVLLALALFGEALLVWGLYRPAPGGLISCAG
ncbi:hypothetical protein [Streptomyces sp. MST-110588]|uniref:hypothetical protein n=1 Tax=Streptomyces sp. MST-110588 TaxID=2833628 RepID=UPI001F5DFE9C|nr:hypothetical protein [Streptomyces sp. MST-110588]UNO43540.1 hypothetical protein KGS77_33780 [Streptomyces sp. MST-110588]